MRAAKSNNYLLNSLTLEFRVFIPLIPSSMIWQIMVKSNFVLCVLVILLLVVYCLMVLTNNCNNVHNSVEYRMKKS